MSVSSTDARVPDGPARSPSAVDHVFTARTTSAAAAAVAASNRQVKIFAPYHLETLALARLAERVPAPTGSATESFAVFAVASLVLLVLLVRVVLAL